MTHRVLEQVGDHLVDERVVDIDERQCEGDVDLQASVAQKPLQASDAVDDQLLDRDSLPFGLQRTGFDAAQAQQVGDKTVESLGLVDNQVEQLVASGVVVAGAAVAKVGADGSDRGERRAKVV